MAFLAPRIVLVLTILAGAALALPAGLADPLVTTQATTGEGNVPDNGGCVNVAYAFFGGPVAVYPYLDGAVGFAATENFGSGATLAFVVVPSLCGPGSIPSIAQIGSPGTSIPALP